MKTKNDNFSRGSIIIYYYYYCSRLCSWSYGGMSLFQYDRAVHFPLKTISNLKLALFFTARTKRIKRYIIISILVRVIYLKYYSVIIQIKLTIYLPKVYQIYIFFLVLGQFILIFPLDRATWTFIYLGRYLLTNNNPSVWQL